MVTFIHPQRENPIQLHEASVNARAILICISSKDIDQFFKIVELNFGYYRDHLFHPYFCFVMIQIKSLLRCNNRIRANKIESNSILWLTFGRLNKYGGVWDSPYRKLSKNWISVLFRSCVLQKQTFWIFNTAWYRQGRLHHFKLDIARRWNDKQDLSASHIGHQKRKEIVTGQLGLAKNYSTGRANLW